MNKKNIREVKNNEEKSSSTTKTKVDEYPVFRIVVLVILNSIINLILRLPSTLLSINETIRSINDYSKSGNIKNYLYISEVICYYTGLCQAIDQFTVNLFLLSLGLDFLLYYNFDKNFKLSKNCVKVKEVL